MKKQYETVNTSKYTSFRLKNLTHNTSADDFVFVRSVIRNSLDPVVPLMAGITRADPNYFVNLQNKGFDKRRLVVLEYVTSGVGHISFNGITKKVSAGDFYILNSEFKGSYHSDPQKPFVKKWVNLNGQLVPALLKAYGIKNQVSVFHFDAERYLDEILNILSTYNEKAPEEDDRKLAHVLTDLFADVKIFSDNAKKELHLANIEEMVRYIDNNLLQNEISVDTLSHEFYVNRRTVHRMFVKEFNMPPLKYITSKKIELAQKMLAENLSVEEVSKQLFFSSAEYFRKVFVSVCGMSPQQYKKQMQKKS